MPDTAIIDTIPVEQRLALAYAPLRIRGRWLAGFALDARLARIVGSSREAMLGQIRLAWWRDRLSEVSPVGGEPLLALIHASGVDRNALSSLVDGWEAVLLNPDGLDDEAILALARSRSGWMAASGDTAEERAIEAGISWALADLARMPDAQGAAALRLAKQRNWSRPDLPKPMRPLAVLHALARRSASEGKDHGPAALLVAARVGLLGF